NILTFSGQWRESLRLIRGALEGRLEDENMQWFAVLLRALIYVWQGEFTAADRLLAAEESDRRGSASWSPARAYFFEFARAQIEHWQGRYAAARGHYLDVLTHID